MTTKNLSPNQISELIQVGVTNKNITLSNFSRLCYGDLTHIGHAILEGKSIMFNGNLLDIRPYYKIALSGGAMFRHEAEHYTIEEPKFIVGGIELDEHPVDRLLKGVGYYSVNMWGKQSNYNPRTNLDSKLLNSYYFKTQQGAQAFTQALNQTIQLPKSCHDEN